MRPQGLNQCYGPFTKPEFETPEARGRYDFGVNIVPMHFPAEPNSPMNMRLFRGKHVIINSSTGAPMSVVTHKYKPVLHRDAIDLFDAGFRKLGTPFDRRIGMSHNGGRMDVEYRFPETKIEITKDDPIAMTLRGVNSFDTTTALAFLLGAWRMICSNGMVVGKGLVFVRALHTLNTNIREIQQDMVQCVDSFKEYGGKLRLWSHTPLVLPALNTYLEHRFNWETPTEGQPNIAKKYVDAIPGAFAGEKVDRLYSLFNAITAIASHRARGRQPALALMKFAHTACEDVYNREREGIPF